MTQVDSQTTNNVHSLAFPLYALLLSVPDLITISIFTVNIRQIMFDIIKDFVLDTFHEN